MEQFGIPFKDPLEILVEWGMNILNEITLSNDENINNKKSDNEQKFSFKKKTGMNNEPFNNLENELNRLKKIVKSRSKYSNSNEYKKFQNEIDLELRSLKKKYRI